MATILENYKKAIDLFYQKTNISIQEGTVFDSLFLSMSEAYTDLSNTIEKNKTPHIYTDLEGEALDSLGFLLGVIREGDEPDEIYLQRVMNHRANHASCNIIAINNAILNLENASNVKYIPMTHGASTATVSIIPIDYNVSTIQKALEEVSSKLKPVVGPTYLYYEIPKPINVTLGIQYSANIENVDETALNEEIKSRLSDYINNIPPMKYLEVGEIERIGINSPNISYFKLYSLYLDDEINSDLKILQKPSMKFLLENINFERR